MLCHNMRNILPITGRDGIAQVDSTCSSVSGLYNEMMFGGCHQRAQCQVINLVTSGWSKPLKQTLLTLQAS